MKFSTFINLLERWSLRTNLVSQNDRVRIVEKHIADCLEITRHALIPTKGALLDMGSGAGFPGVPLAIFYPDLNVTLLDSKRNKTLFLREVVQQAELQSATVVCERIENMSNSYFDFITARAVARLPDLWRWSHSLLQKSGLLIAMKGGDLHRELLQLKQDFDVLCHFRPLYQNDDLKLDKKLVLVSHS